MTDYQSKLVERIITNISKLVNRVAFVKKDNKTVITDSSCYGTKLPTTGVEGQIFFLISQ